MRKNFYYYFHTFSVKQQITSFWLWDKHSYLRNFSDLFGGDMCSYCLGWFFVNQIELTSEFAPMLFLFDTAD